VAVIVVLVVVALGLLLLLYSRSRKHTGNARGGALATAAARAFNDGIDAAAVVQQNPTFIPPPAGVTPAAADAAVPEYLEADPTQMALYDGGGALGAAGMVPPEVRRLQQLRGEPQDAGASPCGAATYAVPLDGAGGATYGIADPPSGVGDGATLIIVDGKVYANDSYGNVPGSNIVKPATFAEQGHYDVGIPLPFDANYSALGAEGAVYGASEEASGMYGAALPSTGKQQCTYKKSGKQCMTHGVNQVGLCVKHACEQPGCKNTKSSQVKMCDQCSSVGGGGGGTRARAETAWDRPARVGGGGAKGTSVVFTPVATGGKEGGTIKREGRKTSVYAGFGAEEESDL
jgi:hypothetical protein